MCLDYSFSYVTAHLHKEKEYTSRKFFLRIIYIYIKVRILNMASLYILLVVIYLFILCWFSKQLGIKTALFVSGDR